MTTLHVEIPDDVFARLRERATDSGFATAEALVVDLIAGATTNAKGHQILSEDRPEELEAELARRIDGPRIAWTAEVQKSLEARIAKMLAERASR